MGQRTCLRKSCDTPRLAGYCSQTCKRIGEGYEACFVRPDQIVPPPDLSTLPSWLHVLGRAA